MKKITAIFFSLAAAMNLYGQTLSWDIKFLQGSGQESVAISRTIRMDTGEAFLISITPALDCFCYVILYDSSREIFVLHDRPIRGGATIHLGPFFIEDPPGTETLYVIIGMERQTMLEALIQNFSNNGSRQNANNLYREVVNLQATVSGLGEPVSSFILSAGTNRGDSPGEYATRFTGKDMYVRAITIRH
ncbi:MAG: DUF4384 domain-containing protein [Treponema sp.]|jgi:hypothetical protein|nr:DUF4384 domain-containing protein [Treponema sp.]